MAETTHTSYRLSDDAKSKLKDLADLAGLNNTEVLNNLIQGEHRYRRDEIDKMKAAKAEGSAKHTCTGKSKTMDIYVHKEAKEK